MYIDPDSIINKNDFKLLQNSAICVICDGIILHPVQCIKCENNFCKSCIDLWIKKKTKEQQCPFKCENPEFKPCRLLNNLLQNLKFKCINGCGTEISYLDLEKHYNENCPKLNNVNLLLKYYHEHYLKEDTSKNNFICTICNNNYENTKRYICQECNFNLCEICKNNYQNFIDSKINLPIFHQHSLFNFSFRKTNWRCNICKNNFEFNKISRFRCKNCDFDICNNCKNDLNYISKSHPHSLVNMTIRETNWRCNICKKNYLKNSVRRYRCHQCDFDICYDCKNLGK